MTETPQQALYFIDFTVENVRCFGAAPQKLDLRVESGEPCLWNLILGENGTGKTTLLRLLGLSKVSERRDARNEIYYSPQAFETSSFVDNVLLYEQRAQVKADTGETASVLMAGGRYKLSTLYTGPHIFGYGAARRMSATSLSVDDAQDPTATLFDDEAHLINAEEWYLRHYLASLEESEFQAQARERLREVKEILCSDLLPDISDIRVTGLAQRNPKPAIEVKSPDGWISVHDMSLGYRTLMAWVVDLAARMFELYAEHTEPLSQPAVVLVDEIDLHLHPKWQRKLVGFLRQRFPAVQFIVTAHSPLIVQATPQDANIILLRREGDHVVIDNDVANIERWRVDQVLTSDLFGLEHAFGPTLDELFARREALLDKEDRTPAEEKELDELDDKLAKLQSTQTPATEEAMKLIRSVAEQLKNNGYAQEPKP